MKNTVMKSMRIPSWLFFIVLWIEYFYSNWFSWLFILAVSIMACLGLAICCAMIVTNLVKYGKNGLIKKTPRPTSKERTIWKVLVVGSMIYMIAAHAYSPVLHWFLVGHVLFWVYNSLTTKSE